MKNPFRKEINPYTVTDKVTFRNVDKTITLVVRSDAPALMTNLLKAEKIMEGVTVESSNEERMKAARFFAWAVFGDESERLIEFYNEPMAVIAAVGKYFDKRLKFLITKAQKK